MAKPTSNPYLDRNKIIEDKHKQLLEEKKEEPRISQLLIDYATEKSILTLESQANKLMMDIARISNEDEINEKRQKIKMIQDEMYNLYVENCNIHAVFYTLLARVNENEEGITKKYIDKIYYSMMFYLSSYTELFIKCHLSKEAYQLYESISDEPLPTVNPQATRKLMKKARKKSKNAKKIMQSTDRIDDRIKKIPHFIANTFPTGFYTEGQSNYNRVLRISLIINNDFSKNIPESDIKIIEKIMEGQELNFENCFAAAMITGRKKYLKNLREIFFYLIQISSNEGMNTQEKFMKMLSEDATIINENAEKLYNVLDIFHYACHQENLYVPACHFDIQLNLYRTHGINKKMTEKERMNDFYKYMGLPDSKIKSISEDKARYDLFSYLMALNQRKHKTEIVDPHASLKEEERTKYKEKIKNEIKEKKEAKVLLRETETNLEEEKKKRQRLQLSLDKSEKEKNKLMQENSECNKKIYESTRELKERIRELEKRLEEAQKDSDELAQLREIVFKEDETEDFDTSKETTEWFNRLLKNKNVYFVGSKPQMLQKVKDTYNGMTVVDVTSATFLKTVFTSCDIIIYSTKTSHSSYYKVRDYAKANDIPIIFFNGDNIDGIPAITFGHLQN